MDCSLPDSSVHGNFKARILKWVTISFSRGSSQPRDWTWVSCTVGGLQSSFIYSHLENAFFCHSDLSIYAIFCNSPKSLSIIILIITSKSQLLYLSCVCVCAQSCLPLCDPMDYSPPGSSVHGIFQARILEWVAISYSRGSSRRRDQTCVLACRFFTTALIILCCNFYFHFLFF